MNILSIFPTTYLFASEIIAPTKDVRHYLNGILVTDEYLVVTDGHRLLSIPMGYSSDKFKLIIPIKAVKALRQQLTAKERREVDVTLSQVENRYQLKAADKVVIFNDIDGRYPNWQHLVPSSNLEVSLEGTFNWNYMADFQKVNSMLGGSKNSGVQLIPHGLNAATIKLSAAPDVIGVILPRSLA